MKIIGNTVGTTMPKPNLMQTDPRKGDYVNGKEEFAEQVCGSGGNVDLTGYATEQWVKDQKYLTEVPEGYATEEFVKNKIAEAELGGEEVDLSGYAKKSELPTKTSQLTNDSGFITKAPVESVNGKAGSVNLSASDVGARPDTWVPTAQEVGALPNTYVPPTQTAEQVGADPTGTATKVVSEHNTDTAAHNDLRLELKAINDRLNAFFDSDNQTLDELSEIVAYITNNKTLIDSITTSKVNVADIINNLTTNVANKPLSAAQGVALKGLIDAVSNSLSNYQPKGDYALKSELPTNVSQLTNDKNYLTAVPSEYVTETELTAKGYITGYTETDPTVPSWAKATSKPSYTASEVGAVPTGRKVNNKALSSDITLSASDVSAVPTTRKVNGKALSSDITLSASDVGALPSTTQVPSKTETWTFTLADGSTVTKAVYVG